MSLVRPARCWRNMPQSPVHRARPSRSGRRDRTPGVHPLATRLSQPIMDRVMSRMSARAMGRVRLCWYRPREAFAPPGSSSYRRWGFL